MKIRRWCCSRLSHLRCLLLILVVSVIIAWFAVLQSCILPNSCSQTTLPESKKYVHENFTVFKAPLEFQNPGQYKSSKVLITFRAVPKKLFFIVIIASSSANPRGLALRNAIRKTWGNCQGAELKSNLIGKKIIKYSMSAAHRDLANYKHCRVVFNVGITGDSMKDGRIRYEAAKYGDLIVSNVMENYRNMTLKLRAGLAEISNLGAKYIVKADNDVYINLLKLAQYLVSDSNLPFTLYGGVTYTTDVERSPGHRHFVRQEDYSEKNYPLFCKGSMVILSGHALLPAVKLFSHVKPFNIDDAYLGIVLNKLGITPVRIDKIVQFKYLPVMLSHLHYCDFMYLIGVGDSMTPRDIYKVHDLMRMSNGAPSWMCWNLGITGWIILLLSVAIAFCFIRRLRRR
eukprot:gene15931-17532_t